jgi:hypothetical protein
MEKTIKSLMDLTGKDRKTVKAMLIKADDI